MGIFDDLNPINAINDAINAVKNEATSVVNTIGDGLTQFGDDIANGATDAANTIASGATDAANTIAGGVTDGLNAGVDFAKSTANDVAQETLNAADTVANAVTSTSNAVIQWSSLEVAKGVAITAVLLGLRKSIGNDPAAAALQAVVDSVNKGFGLLNPVSTDWHTWLASHATTGDAEFGVTTVLDEDYTNFSLFKSSIARWDATNNKTIVPALAAAKAKTDLPSFQALKTALAQSVTGAQKISGSIPKNYASMAADGLSDHQADLAAAQAALA